MRLPKKTKWVKRKNKRVGASSSWAGMEGCLLNGATLRTPGEWTGGGADISTVIYHPARPARKLSGLIPGPATGPVKEEGKIEKEERREEGSRRSTPVRGKCLPVWRQLRTRDKGTRGFSTSRASTINQRESSP
ncbi:hypothetical protein KM043_017987 [Ampulex compressa]|nr:hypothetical protein KM043_017987 [Ampulex compressa]